MFTSLTHRIARQRAFTLIELLVVILIIGILIAVAAPSFLGQQDKAQVSKLAQMEAVAYKAEKAASVSGSYASVQFNTGSQLVSDVTASEPELQSVLTTNAATTSTPGQISVANSTAGTFDACGYTPSGTAVTYSASATGAPQATEASACLSSPAVLTQAALASTPYEGQADTAIYNFSGNPAPTYTYQWYDCTSASVSSCTASIGGATLQTHTLTLADGPYISVTVTAHNASGSASSQSAPVAYTPPIPDTPPTFFGTATVGQPLTATNGTWMNTGGATWTYQWQRCNSSGSSCAPITGATAPTYTLQGADSGNTIAVTVTATNANGAGSITSLLTPVVTP